MRVALAKHDELLRSTVQAHGGHVFKHTGDGICAAFGAAGDAVAAAVAAQGSLGLLVRMGIHVGDAEERDEDYFGPTLNRVARVMDAGHGGQILLSEAAAALLGGDGLVDLGSHQLRDLGAAQHIFQVGDREFPRLRTLDAYLGNLPTALDSFVGRVDEVSDLIGQLDSHRLVTLTGVGGVGKTRLALHAAAEMLPNFAQGCWLVELAPIADEASVPVEIGQSLGIEPRAGESPLDTVVHRLREQARLVVLDNCEHVLDAAGHAVETILRACPGVRIIATSREGLGVRGEQILAVRSLGNAARELFMERAAEVNPGIVERPEMEVIEELCARLDGVPLAIELAAARTRSMAPAEILDRLDQRFRLLRGGRRRAERHQTIRGTIEWSYDLLDADEQLVFCRLGVFAGDFTLSEAEAVASGGKQIDVIDVVEHVDSLTVKSMLQVDASGGAARFRLLETVRQYAIERLVESGEEVDSRDRHAELFIAIAVKLNEQAYSPARSEALDAFVRAGDEIVAALDWLTERGRLDDAVTLVDMSNAYWTLRSMDEGMRRTEQLLAHRDEMSKQSLVVALSNATNYAWNAGYARRARDFGEEALTLTPDGERELLERAIGGLMSGLYYTGEAEKAVTFGREELERLEEADIGVARPDAIITVLLILAQATSHRPVESLAWAAEAQTAADRLGDPLFIAAAHCVKARALVLEDPLRARTEAERSLELGQDLNQPLLLTSHAIIAWTLATEGRNVEASRSMLASIEQIDALGVHNLAGYSLLCSAATYALVDPTKAAELLGSRLGLYGRLECESPPDEQLLEDAVLDHLRGGLDAEQIEQAIDAGRGRNLEHAAGLIRDLAVEVEAAS